MTSHSKVPVERGMLFSAPMVRAILDGRKTMTRRVVKYEVTGPNPPNTLDFRLPDAPPTNGKLSRLRGWQGALDATTRKGNALKLCPYGQPGDRLWVREAWREDIYDHSTHYRATHPCPDLPKWKPSIHMPRWASRITLKITAVRVERLQDISEQDAKAEGARECDPVTGREVVLAGQSQRGSYVLHFRDLWESINGPGSWALNPWVWVIEYRRV